MCSMDFRRQFCTIVPTWTWVGSTMGWVGLGWVTFLYFVLKTMGASFTTERTYHRLVRMVPKLSMKPIHSLDKYFTYFTYLMKSALCMRKTEVGADPVGRCILVNGLGWVGSGLL